VQNDPFVILGVSESATQSEIFDAYKRLRDKYSDERFLEGEAGANAARKLNELYDAYNEAMDIASRRASVAGGGSKYYGVENAIRQKNFAEAQRLLDNISSRDGEWHYLQSVVFYNNNWLLESKKQLEIAIEKEPGNEKYRRSLSKLNSAINGERPHQESWYNADKAGGQTTQNTYTEGPQNRRRSYSQYRGGGQSDTANCCNACSACLCADCCCECMGGDLITCC
jgi:DnaJ-class molecular chaperone